jgi:hypothetical protein
LNGIAGRFEWIIDLGAVTHRMFVRGGAVTGVPIVPMNYLDEFRRAGLAVNWCTIAVGWDGPGSWPRLLTLDDVQRFAESALSAANPVNERELIDIVAASPNDRDGIDKAIRALAGASTEDRERELRKWRVVFLTEQLLSCPPDPLYGLLALTEFWEKFGFPQDSPHVVQGRGNTMAPNEYYSEENYRRVMQRHRCPRF